MYFSIVGTEERKEKIRGIMNNRQKGLVVVLEDIYDPHNAAAVIRTAEAFGISDVWFVFNEGKAFNPRKIGSKTASYANQWIRFRKFKSTKECLTELHNAGYEIIATALTQNAESIFSANIKKEKVALLFGNEHAGLTPLAIELSDRTIIIPMRGMVQSLNLSVTAALVMYKVIQERMEDENKYIVSDEDAQKLFNEFEHI